MKCTGTLGSGVPQISIGSAWSRADIGAVDVSGGGTAGVGIYTATRTTISGATVHSQAVGVQGDGAGAVVRMVGCDTASCSANTSLLSGATQVGAGNSLND